VREAARSFEAGRADLQAKPAVDLPNLSLSVGDPTLFGNLPVDERVVAAVQEQLLSQKSNGYPPSTGYPAACEAIAKRHSLPSHQLSKSDVIITSGCSGALAIAIPTLADPGDNVLIPRPGFSLYEVICSNSGIEARFYRLDGDRQWEADLADLERQIDGRTRAIIVNNPSNPCGSNYSAQHLAEIAAVAARHRLPIIADEIYGGIVFAPAKFVPLAAVAPDLPIVSVGGLAKQFLCPGWRLGWIVLYDRHGRLARVRSGMVSMSQVILGANSLVQAALPQIFATVPSAYFEKLSATLAEQGRYFSDAISKIRGFRAIEPQGAMYLLIRIDTAAFRDVPNDVSFCQMLLAEQNVSVLPGKVFGAPNHFRVVVCAPRSVMEAVIARIAAFATRHAAA
jgi:tyrosine aminotransferase